jgi:hypothetical protein
MEERRGQLAAGGFGAEDSMKIIKSVMEKTNAKIEMSSNKDQSLTFLISGRQVSTISTFSSSLLSAVKNKLACSFRPV